MRHAIARPTYAAVVCASLVAAALLVVLGRAVVEPRFDRSLTGAPPRVETASIELLARPVKQANAVVRMQFVDARRGTPLVIQGGYGPVSLRDDGVAPDTAAADGSYAAFVHVNGEQVMLEAGVPAPLGRFRGVAASVDPARSLVVTDPLVIDDPARTYQPCSGRGAVMGAWTFGKLMADIANTPATGIDPAFFVDHWLGPWKTRGDGVPAASRPAGLQEILDDWPRGVDGRLDIERAPFRLLAIVNRVDLRGSTLYGSFDAGEVQLVFGAVRCARDRSVVRQPTPLTVSFDYAVTARSCADLRAWAAQWQALGSRVLGSVAYNMALQGITDQVTSRDADPARTPNRSALHRIRTIELAAGDRGDTVRQWRESRLRDAGRAAGLLEHHTSPDAEQEGASWTAPSIAEMIDRQQRLDMTAHMSCLEASDFPLEDIFFEPRLASVAH
jgi:hypothetical protein